MTGDERGGVEQYSLYKTHIQREEEGVVLWSLQPSKAIQNMVGCSIEQTGNHMKVVTD